MMQTELCRRVFELEFPPTEVELKSKYRTLSKERHPDTGGSHKAFVELKEAYDMLLGYATEAKKYQDRTSQGDLLVDLGKGLGPTTNGAHCKDCNSLGYIQKMRVTSYTQTPCLRCQIQCGRCAGRGKLKATLCPECAGTGTFRLLSHCFACLTVGYLSKPVYTPVYLTCSLCEGTGEIQIMNPVLPKGAVR